MKRGSDFENLGARIVEIGVAVAMICERKL
jgi:hypothetical protein